MEVTKLLLQYLEKDKVSLFYFTIVRPISKALMIQMLTTESYSIL